MFLTAWRFKLWCSSQKNYRLWKINLKRLAARFKNRYPLRLGQWLRDGIRQSSPIDPPLKTRFLQSLGFKRSLVACSSSSPPRGIQGDDSRPIRATIAFDFSLSRWVIRKFQKISRTLLMLLMLLNAFNTYRAVKPHMTTDLRWYDDRFTVIWRQIYGDMTTDLRSRRLLSIRDDFCML